MSGLENLGGPLDFNELIDRKAENLSILLPRLKDDLDELQEKQSENARVQSVIMNRDPRDDRDDIRIKEFQSEADKLREQIRQKSAEILMHEQSLLVVPGEGKTIH